MRKLRHAGVLALFFLISSGASAASVPPNDAALIREVRADWVAAMNSRDAEFLVSFYDEGAVLMTSYAPPQLGRQAIHEWYARQFEKIDPYYEYRADSLRFHGSRAVERWTAVITLARRARDGMELAGDPIQFLQRGARVYRKDARGDWTIDRDVWTGDQTAARYLTTLLLSGCPPLAC